MTQSKPTSKSLTFTFNKQQVCRDCNHYMKDHNKEGCKAIPSRKVGHQNTELYNLIQSVMNRLRKRNCYFIYTDQWRRGADIMIRTNVDFLENPAMTKDDVNHKKGEIPLFYYEYMPTG